MKKLTTILLSVLLPFALLAQTPREMLQRQVGTNTIIGTNTSVPFQVSTIAALKASTVTYVANGQVVNVLGYYTVGDGGGGSFTYNSTNTATDNGGTVIQPATGAGRWVRSYFGAVSVRWFGAKGDNLFDDTGPIQAALSMGGSIVFPAGTYRVTTQLSIGTKTSVSGSGRGATVIQWGGAANGTLFSISGSNQCSIRNVTLATAISGHTGKAISIVNSDQFTVSGVEITASNFIDGFGTCIDVTGNGSATTSNILNLHDLVLGYFKICGIRIDHAAEVSISNIFSSTVADSVGGQGMIIDTGVSGLYVRGADFVYGEHGVNIRNVGSGGAYGGCPHYLFFNQLLADSNTGGDGVIFDSSLGANTVDAKFSNCWVSQAGCTGAGAVVTTGAVGVHINGGGYIQWTGGSINWNALHGIWISSANVAHVQINGARIRDNNLSNNVAGQGFYLSATISDLVLNDCQIGNNFTAGETKGHQKYGVLVDTIGCDRISILCNNFAANEAGSIQNGTTGRTICAGNLGPSDILNQFNGGTVSFGVGISSTGVGVKHTRISTGSIGATGGNVTVNWSPAFVDSNYTVICTVLDTTSGNENGLQVERISDQQPGSITVKVVNLSLGSITGTLECFAVHD